MEKKIVDYSEYNKIYLPRAENLAGFFKRLDHAVKKSGAYDEVMHQLRCIGLSEDLAKTAEEAAHLYKEHHKKRIAEEQQGKRSVDYHEPVYAVFFEQRLPDSTRETRLLNVFATSKDAKDHVEKLWFHLKDVFREAVVNWVSANGALFAVLIESHDNNQEQPTCHEIWLENHRDTVYCTLRYVETRLE